MVAAILIPGWVSLRSCARPLWTRSITATNGIGTSTLAAREVIAGRMDDYLKPQTSLSAGFLRPGQSGKITVKFTLAASAKQKPLQLKAFITDFPLPV